MNMKVVIESSLRPNLPNVLASAVVVLETEVGPIRITDCRVIQAKNGAIFFSLPTFSVQHAQRHFEYRPTVELPAGLGQEISIEALKAYDVWKQGSTR